MVTMPSNPLGFLTEPSCLFLLYRDLAEPRRALGNLRGTHTGESQSVHTAETCPASLVTREMPTTNRASRAPRLANVHKSDEAT